LQSYRKEVLAFRESYRKEVVAVFTSNRKEVLASRRIQAQATRKKPQEVADLRTQKEVLSRALFWGCTVVIHYLSYYLTSELMELLITFSQQKI